jgi:hypothetical protein
MKTPEGHEKSDIDKYLKSIGAYVVKPATFGYGKSGHADRVCCINGTFWSIEVKREGKGPAKLQEARISEVRASGGQACWGTAEKVISEINAYLKNRAYEDACNRLCTGNE